MSTARTEPRFNLTAVESHAALKRAWQKMEQAIGHGARRERKTIGDRSGAISRNLFIREDLGIWMAPSAVVERGYVWMPFGVLPIQPSKNLSVVVQINRVGTPDGHPVAGTLAADPSGAQWICHSGGVGGGRPGIGKRAFLAWSGIETVPVTTPNGGSRRVIPLGRVGDPNLPHDIAAFVKQVAAFKAGRRAPARRRGTRKPPPGLAAVTREPDQSTTVEGRRGYEMHRLHGTLCNCLIDAIASVRKDIGNDRARDLFVGKPQRPEIQFEIKPSSDTQSVYTAIGQLMLHGTQTPARRRVIVLPDPVKPPLRGSFRKLGIELVTFSVTRGQVRFRGLDTLLPGTPDVVPLTPR